MIRCEQGRRVRVVVPTRSDGKIDRVIVDRKRHAHVPEIRVLVDYMLELVTQCVGARLMQIVNLPFGRADGYEHERRKPTRRHLDVGKVFQAGVFQERVNVRISKWYPAVAL